MGGNLSRCCGVESTQQPEKPAKATLEGEGEEEEEEEEETACNSLIPSLPDDVALECLARVPCQYHKILFQVSKPICSLLSSPLFFKTRSNLRATQLVLYLKLHLYREDDVDQWFALTLDTDLALDSPVPPTITPVPRIPNPTVRFDEKYAVVGHHVYVTCSSYSGSKSQYYSTEVWILDCRFNSWRQGPDMLVPRCKGAAVVALDGKVYVLGGCEPGSSVWAERFDPEVSAWEHVVSPYDGGEYKVDGCKVVDDMINARIPFVAGMVVYDPNGTWKTVDEFTPFWEMQWSLVDDVYCLWNSVTPATKEGTHNRNHDHANDDEAVKWLNDGNPMPHITAEIAGHEYGEISFLVSVEERRDLWFYLVDSIRERDFDFDKFSANIRWYAKIASFPNCRLMGCFGLHL